MVLLRIPFIKRTPKEIVRYDTGAQRTEWTAAAAGSCTKDWPG